MRKGSTPHANPNPSPVNGVPISLEQKLATEKLVDWMTKVNERADNHSLKPAIRDRLAEGVIGARDLASLAQTIDEELREVVLLPTPNFNTISDTTSALCGSFSQDQFATQTTRLIDNNEEFTDAIRATISDLHIANAAATIKNHETKEYQEWVLDRKVKVINDVIINCGGDAILNSAFNYFQSDPERILKSVPDQPLVITRDRERKVINDLSSSGSDTFFINEDGTKTGSFLRFNTLVDNCQAKVSVNEKRNQNGRAVKVSVDVGRTWGR